MKLILLGAPGAGKGTLASQLINKLGVPSISTGNLLREAIAQKTELGMKAKEYMDSGNLVPDELVINLLKEKIADCANGYILDGFPRTIPQAKALEEITSIDVALSVEVPDELIEKRMTGRRVCAKCGETYHLENNPPKVINACDKCDDQELSVRKDDEASVVRARLETYHKETEPLKAFYEERGKLREMDGTKPVNESFELALKVLGV